MSFLSQLVRKLNNPAFSTKLIDDLTSKKAEQTGLVLVSFQGGYNIYKTENGASFIPLMGTNFIECYLAYFCGSAVCANPYVGGICCLGLLGINSALSKNLKRTR